MTEPSGLTGLQISVQSFFSTLMTNMAFWFIIAIIAVLVFIVFYYLKKK